MAEEPDPPRKHYGFKEREFKRDNHRASSAPPMPTAKDLAKMADASPSEVGGASRPDGLAAGGRQMSGHKAPPTPNKSSRVDPNDVRAVLAANREVEKQFGGDVIGINKVSSRRKRDYWLVFLTLEIIFGGIVAVGIKQPNPFFLVFGLTGMVVFGIAITWIMWQLLDRY